LLSTICYSIEYHILELIFYLIKSYKISFNEIDSSISSYCDFLIKLLFSEINGRYEARNIRAEIWLRVSDWSGYNQRIIEYDLIGNSSFEPDQKEIGYVLI